MFHFYIMLSNWYINFILKMFGMNFVQDKNKYNTSHITQNVSVFNSDVNNIYKKGFLHLHM